jgi:hypothetical protein
MRRAERKRQAELNAYVIEELKELRALIQQTNSELAKVRDTLAKHLKDTT